jgi:hypothetical protein
MDKREAAWRLMGADDFIKIFVKTLESMGKLTPEDKQKTLSMMESIRDILLFRYQRNIHET